MFKAIVASTLTLTLCVAAMYGYDVSMTAEGFVIQGYIGAAIPVVFTLIGAGFGALLAN